MTGCGVSTVHNPSQLTTCPGKHGEDFGAFPLASLTLQYRVLPPQARWLQCDVAPQIRNKHLSKRDTEKSIKEIWKARLEDQKGGQTSELPDFIYQHWQKKVGIAAAVVEVRFLPVMFSRALRTPKKTR